MVDLARWRQAYSNSNDSGMEVLTRIKLLLFKPDKFFEHIRDAKPRESIIFLVALSLAAELIGIFSDILRGSSLSFSFYNLLYFPIAGIIFAGFLHVLMKLFKGSGCFFDSLKATSYSFISILIGIVVVEIIGSTLILEPVYALIIGTIIMIWLFILELLGLSKYHNFSRTKTFLILLIPMLIISYFFLYPSISAFGSINTIG